MIEIKVVGQFEIAHYLNRFSEHNTLSMVESTFTFKSTLKSYILGWRGTR